MSMNNVRYGFLSIAFIGNAIIGEHYRKGQVSVFLYRREDIFPSGEIGVLSCFTGFVEDIELPACNRTYCVDRARAMYEKGAGISCTMDLELYPENFAQGFGHFFCAVPIYANQFEGIEGDVCMGAAAAITALPAGKRGTAFFLSFMYGFGHTLINKGIAIQKH